MYETIAFYIFGALSAAMFLMTVTTKNVIYALSTLAAGMIFISAFFFLLDAEFLGVVQIVVYTGAVMALYAFGMMFFDTIKDVDEKVENPRQLFLYTGLSALMIVLIFSAPIIGDNLITQNPIPEDMGNIEAIGLVIFTKYLVPFELAAVMLLVAMIAGIILAGKKMDQSLTLMCEEDENIEKDDYIKVKKHKGAAK
ncbi:MAG: NADH-quinone oxidoreductase subunit J [Campylobacterales bacterium]